MPNHYLLIQTLPFETPWEHYIMYCGRWTEYSILHVTSSWDRHNVEGLSNLLHNKWLETRCLWYPLLPHVPTNTVCMLLSCYQLAVSLSGTIVHLNSGELCFHDENVQNESQRKNCHHQMHEAHNHTDCEQMAQSPGTQTNVADVQSQDNYRNLWVSEQHIKPNSDLLISIS